MQEVTNVQRLSKRVAGLKPSGIRKFFDIAATMKDVISLGIGEPDFTTPKPILDAGIRSLQNGETHYTSNWGKMELRQAISDNLQRLYQIKYDPTNEIIATVGGSIASRCSSDSTTNSAIRFGSESTPSPRRTAAVRARASARSRPF